MNLKTWVPLALALVLGLVAAMMARNMLSRKDAPQATGTGPAKVVVAKDTIAAGSELRPEQLAMATLTVEIPPAGTFASIKDLDGRVTTKDLVPGLPIQENFLAGKGAASGLQALIPAGKRCVTIKVDDASGLAGLINPGCHVDVVSTIHDPNKGDSLAKAVVQNATVTAVGPRMTGAAAPPGPDGQAQAPMMYQTVTLLVSPKDADAIELISRASPRLVLRNDSDEEPVDEEYVSMADLRGAGDAEAGPEKQPAVVPVQQVAPGNPAAPTTQPVQVKQDPFKTPPAPERIQRVVQIIRGTAETTATFDLGPKASDSVVTDTSDATDNK